MSSQAQFPLTSPQWENSCLLSSIKQEKNLPGDRGVRREVPASPSRSLSPSLSFSIHLFKLAKKTTTLGPGLSNNTLFFFISPFQGVCVQSEKANLHTQRSKSALYCKYITMYGMNTCGKEYPVLSHAEQWYHFFFFLNNNKLPHSLTAFITFANQPNDGENTVNSTPASRHKRRWGL